MKKIIFSRKLRLCLLFIIFTGLFIACKKNSIETETPLPPESVSGQATPVGEPQETPVTATIGAAGGTLQSADGQVRIVVPSGALAGDNNFSVQRITNTNIAGRGSAYRLLPHGLQFSKPIIISFFCDTANFEEIVADAIGIAYQDDKGVWQGSGAIYDSVAKTFSVSTSHFSDWSLFTAFAINPVTAALEPGKTLHLSVVNYMSDDLPVPPVPGVKKPIGPQHDLNAQYIKEWKLAGEGKLIANGSEADYIAPTTIPSKNPVAVSVSLNGSGNSKYLLVSNIYIGAEGITFRINNGPWLRGTIPLGVVEAEGIHSLDAAVVPADGGAANAALSLKWSGYPSGWHLNWGKKLPWFLYQPPGTTIYQQFIVQGKNIIPSLGGVHFSSYSETKGKDIIGSFILEQAGKMESTGTGVKWTPVKIEGFFKTKRNTL
ncbi:MAG: hypothetical protein JST63_19455 [Bacteroidetes bacterium]|nr:hypothetical protein [Bacteroidota bacterium]